MILGFFNLTNTRHFVYEFRSWSQVLITHFTGHFLILHVRHDVRRWHSSIRTVRRREETFQYPSNMENIDLNFDLSRISSHGVVHLVRVDSQDGKKRGKCTWEKHQHSWDAALPAVSHSVSVARNDTQAVNRRVWKTGSSVQCGSRWKVFATRHFC